MKRAIISIFTSIALSLFLLSTPLNTCFAIDGFIRFTNPTGGETLHVGQNYTIRWESSTNIDQVNIGYKSCPSCLDWVVFTTPNTGSYNWNVNIGNTTNTQFYLQITGYETGKGSLTASSGIFTVEGGSKAPSTSNPTTTSSPSNSSSKSPIIGRRIPTPTSTPRPTPSPTPIPLTLSTIHLSSTFIFEGSQTTDLSKITDPKHVTNFTLDTKYDWTIVFTEEIDFTDKKKLGMLRDLDTYWVVEWWFVWIKIEWWEVFNVPCEITLKNEQLTGFQPTIITSQNSTLQKESTVSGTPQTIKPIFKKGKPGEVVLGITDGGKLEIKPKVQFVDKPTQPITTDTIKLNALTSHKNLEYVLMVNGQTSSISAEVKNDGSFVVTVPKLIEGANYIELSFKEASDSSFIKAESLTTIYKPLTIRYVFIALAILLTVATTGGLIYAFRNKLRTVFSILIKKLQSLRKS